MIKRIKKLVALSLITTVLSGVSVKPANACIAELDSAVIISGIHPDHPLKFFAGGNIGIVQPGWAKSYLCVVYRYLTNKPLSKTEQDSVVKLWHDRLTDDWTYWNDRPDPIEAFVKLRANALGHNASKDMDKYYRPADTFSSEKGVNKDAFTLANKTLNALIKQFGAKSSVVKDWIGAQDLVFAIVGDKVKVPAELPKSAPSTLKKHRAYQIASATLYLPDYKKAGSLFKEISLDSTSPFQQVAHYLVLRCKERHLQKDKDTTIEEWNEATATLTKAAANAKTAREREDILNLLRPLIYAGRPQDDVILQLAEGITGGTTQRFGGDIGDLTFLMDISGSYLDNYGPHKPTETTAETATRSAASQDLIDWISATQKRDDYSFYESDDTEEKAANKASKARAEQAKKALDTWREKKTLPWLVTAITYNGLRSQENHDLYDAANKVLPNSPAYLTCRFYIIDALLAKKKKDEAKRLLSGVLASKSLPPTSYNLFTSQMAATTTSASEFLKYAIVKPGENVSTTASVSREILHFATLNSFHNEPPTYDEGIAEDLNRYAPLSVWMSLATNKSLDPRFRAVISRAAWLRALLLNKPQIAAQLEPEVAATNPSLARPLARYRSAQPGAARNFALASLVLHNYGLSPYMQGGAERHGLPINEFDWYQDNFWQPFEQQEAENLEERANPYFGSTGDPSFRKKMTEYLTPGLKERLSANQKKTAEAERKIILNNHPSSVFGKAVLTWARLHPGDKEVPELLYKVVKLPKWSGTSSPGTQYSREAYLLLHSRYEGSSWADKAVCYY